MSNLSTNMEEKTNEDICENQENENVSQNLSLVFEKSRRNLGRSIVQISLIGPIPIVEI